MGGAYTPGPEPPGLGSHPTPQGSEPGRAGRRCPLPAGLLPHKGPIVWLRLWAAGGCLVTHGEALPPAARAEEGTAGTGGAGARRAGLGWGTAHTEPGLPHEGAYSPDPSPARLAWTACGEAALTRPRAPGQGLATPGTWMLSLWPGQWLGLATVGRL